MSDWIKTSLLDESKFPFTRVRDNLTGKESIFADVHSPEDPPTHTGEILVRLRPSGTPHDNTDPGWDIVTVTELGFEYRDGYPADPSEWSCWIDLSTFSKLKNDPEQWGITTE